MPDADSLPSADAALLAETARAAGALALGFFQRDPQVFTKADASPVTEADLAVDRFVAEALRPARPGYGWLSEEGKDDDERLARRRVFVVDPIDGTRAFIAGKPDWTISLAVVEDGRPFAAALYCPVTDEMFVAERGGGARLDDTPLAVRTDASLVGCRLAAPSGFSRAASVKAAGIETVGFVHSLAYRLALVAAGRIDAAAASSRACDWDIAAADLIVHEAGGRLSNLDGEPVRYNRRDVSHPPLVAAGGRLHGELTALFAAFSRDDAPLPT
ncbi:3'(2'),5'-bisphosphate nucleotidase CysQ [Segnochrobactrum spirostomi]|uniref:3'(2'),5'-bisphosphate nucleotidase CysQ n=1 Tax=Segnochrobactrum spirostomi TaxID=2608987 RepID=A0A6A7Y598_9HYPH|nr:3'(2'),5'-bisphosphate nucleotidase CysQ [Segnochrobactrum spirostomi]MQT13885.1 3'(2'),5'-bisphosphate nucleotidase CysQ [Segnochrobactrum spirostomi]